MKRRILLSSLYGLVLVFATFFSWLSGVAMAVATPPAGPCSVVGTPFLTIKQSIINDPDTTNFAKWAIDDYTDNTKVWVGTDGSTYCGTTDVTDASFVTFQSLSPEKGVQIPSGITGTFSGGENYTFPGSLKLSSSYSTTSLQAVTLPESPVAGFSWWVNQVFPSVASSSGSYYASTYSFTYTTPHNGTWVDADPTSGGDVGDISPIADNATSTESFSSRIGSIFSSIVKAILGALHLDGSAPLTSDNSSLSNPPVFVRKVLAVAWKETLDNSPASKIRGPEPRGMEWCGYGDGPLESDFL